MYNLAEKLLKIPIKKAAPFTFLSKGMVLFACHEEPDKKNPNKKIVTKMELVRPPKGSKIGERCFLEGADSAKIAYNLPLCDFNTMVIALQDFKTNDSCELCFKGKKF